jgi:hypothetical protein
MRNAVSSDHMTAGSMSFSERLGTSWNSFWFLPADGRPLAVIRIVTAILGLVLWSSYSANLQQWFGPGGVISPAVLDVWRAPYGISLFDTATTAASLWAVYVLGFVAFGALLLGIGTTFAAAASAVLWVSILHRGPMLIGPADDVLAVLLWCLVIGRSGDYLSLDSLWRKDAARPSVRNRLALSFIGFHASAITIAALLSQLKADIWWDGTAAWWLLTGREQGPGSVMTTLVASEYLTNVITHAITLFEIIFAAGVWVVGLRGSIVALGVLAWPLIGWLAGDLAWGVGMATLGLAWAPSSWFRSNAS